MAARTVTVEIKYVNYSQIRRLQSCAGAITSKAPVEQLALDLLRSHLSPPRGVKLLGVTLSNFAAATAVEIFKPALAPR